MLTLLSFGNIRICLLGDSEGLFVSLKISHTFDHNCARLYPPLEVSISGLVERKMSTGRLEAGQLSIGHGLSYLKMEEPRKKKHTLKNTTG